MSATTDKIKGNADKAVGSVKQAAGEAVGNDRLQAEGAAQKAAGHVEVGIGKAKDAVKNVVDKA